MVQDKTAKLSTWACTGVLHGWLFMSFRFIGGVGVSFRVVNCSNKTQQDKHLIERYDNGPPFHDHKSTSVDTDTNAMTARRCRSANDARSACSPPYRATTPPTRLSLCGAPTISLLLPRNSRPQRLPTCLRKSMPNTWNKFLDSG
jgi:hypothetical protein